MKRIILLTALFTLTAAPRVAAQQTVEALEGIGIDNVTLTRDGKYLTVSMTLDMSDLNVKGNRAVLITPLLQDDDHNKPLKAIGVYSRNRYYHYARNDRENMLSGPDEMTYRANRLPDTLHYETIVAYERWMDGANLTLTREEYGCCRELKDEQLLTAAVFHDKPAEFMPLAAYVQPQVEPVKMRALSGTAYIDFPVNRTDIRPDYRNNRRELDKILATIDSVRADADVSITSLSIKGYASPEGSYALNTRLAAGRTEALKQYVSQLYRFDDDFIRTESEPEDWDGLRRFVEDADLQHRDEILALIDSNREPDNKEWKLKSTYPDEYRYLLQHCYPALRHSDYRIEYVVRGFSDIGEIRRLMHSSPQKLSLQELFLVAQQCEPGSDEFNEVFEIAVRMYPDDPIANLNAANTALRQRNVTTARRYLSKAGQSPQATYTRGICALLEADYDEARTLLTQARAEGVTQAAQALTELEVMEAGD